MQPVLVPLAALIGILSSAVGLLWLVAPARMAKRFPIDMPGGVTLSTLIAISSAWSLTIGLSVLAGLYFREPAWFYPAAMLLGIVALGRLVAGLLHGAPLVMRRLVAEVILAGLMVATGSSLV